MTRINCGIPVKLLSDKHLLAEHREIKRIPNCIKSGRYNLNGIPDKFTLGTGHVKFFYNKLFYLKIRYMDLYNECKARGFNITFYIDAFTDLPFKLDRDYIPTLEDKKIVVQRLLEKDKTFYEKRIGLILKD
jgi:deoxyribonuclease (pyrimidine dimer)